MAIFKCKMCGGSLDVAAGTSVIECEYCGTNQTLPTAADENLHSLFNRANTLRMKSEFDKAEQLYEKILQADGTQAEAYWGLILCKYGIEYVEDPKTFARIPTCHRTSFDSIIADDDYKSALEHADASSRALYEKEAREIDRIQKDILALSQKEEPYDVFICYKETDDSGKRTQDSVIANDIYYELTKEGFKVFYAAITLEDKLGTAYEPSIFAALNSAKVMLAIGTKPEYFSAVWVKNEWSRYLKMMKADRSKLLIPCYRDMDPYELPEEFAHLQAQDMGKIGFINDIVRGIKKVLVKDTPAPVEKVVVETTASASTAPLLERAFMFLEDGEWERADDFCEQVLNIDPKCAEAYLGKLMAELKVRKRELLADCEKPFDYNNNYQKAQRFGDDKLNSELTGYIENINNRICEGIYIEATAKKEKAKSEDQFKDAAGTFSMIPSYKDADEQLKICLELAETARKEKIYSDACYKLEANRNNKSYLLEASVMFRSIAGYKDADQKEAECDTLVADIKAEEERKAEEDKIRAAANKKKAKKIAAIVIPSLVAVAAIVILAIMVFIPNSKYNDAVALMNAGQYEEAIAAFEAIDGYKDSATQIENCKIGILDDKYDTAVALMNSGDYEEAHDIFEDLAYVDYKDSKTQKSVCKYLVATELMSNGDYENAVVQFALSNNYKDSADQITKCYYLQATTCMNDSDYENAIVLFSQINDYKDSEELINECNKNLFISKYGQEVYDKFGIVDVGNLITFGSCEQDNNFDNGSEEIQWRVLEVKDGKALIISDQALDCKAYSVSTDSADNSVDSIIHKWLNNEFLNEVFSTEEQSKIAFVTLFSDKQDIQLFLLSVDEANTYFSSSTERICTPSVYALRSDDFNNSKGWWLRSATDRAVVSHHGNIKDSGYIYAAYVRPAMWIDLSVGD